MSSTNDTPALRRAFAWGVHLYTALGLVADAAIAALIIRGDAEAFRASFALMLVACLIDASDGTLARLVRVKEVLPGFDGSRLDDIVDFLSYTFLPLLLVWRARILPAELDPVLLVALVASAYGFCQVRAKTPDGYFIGFPSYWNVVAFYLYVLHPPALVAAAIVLVLALLTFVPSKYLYPSQPGALNQFTSILGLAWGALLVWILFKMPADVPPPSDPHVVSLVRASLIFPAYYMLASWVITIKSWSQPG